MSSAPIASNLDELSEKLASEEVELSILINGRLRGRRKVGGFRDLLETLVKEASSRDKLVRVKIAGPGGEYRIYAYNGVVVGVVGETSSGKLLGGKALRVLEDVKDIGVVDVWETGVDGLPSEVREALGAARPEEARPPPPEGWVGLSLHGFKVLGLHSDKGAFNYIMLAEAPWGEKVALKIPKIKPGSPTTSLAVYRMISEAQVLARLYSVDRRIIEANLDALGYPRDLARIVGEGRRYVIRVYTISAPKREYGDPKDYLYHPPFVAMELADGDLEDLEASEPREELVSSVARQVGNVLALAHALGVGHFDLKPANVLYKRADGGYLLKLSDFTGYNRLDGRFLVDLFTPEYSDPLLVASRGRAGTPSSDVFNLAALLYRVARGAPCHCVWILNTLMLSALSGRPPPRRAIDSLRARDPRVAAYISRVERAVAAMKREALGMSGVIERIRDSYEECIQDATAPLREPLRSVLRRALTLNRRARPRDAIDYYTRSLLSI